MHSSTSSPVWVCYGAGTDSTAMIIRMVLNRERIDLITFADTGAELPHTYNMIPTMNAWLKQRGYPEIQVVRYANRSGKSETLEESIVKNETIPSLAFGWHTCSIRFKIEPQVRFAKNFEPFIEAWKRGEKVIRCIGYDAGDADSKRANRSMTKYPHLNLFENRYPLREWGYNRARCREEILAAGLPDPQKSACYFCPARKKHEIEDLAVNHTEFYTKAIQIESAALDSGKLTSVQGLGRRFAWKELSFGAESSAAVI